MTNMHNWAFKQVTEEEAIRTRSRLTRTADVRKYSLLGAGKVKMVERVTLESLAVRLYPRGNEG